MLTCILPPKSHVKPSKQDAHVIIPRLKEHADDGHHRKSSVRKLRRELLSLLSRVAGGQDLEAEVTCCSRRAGRLILGNLAERHVGKDLTPTCGGNFGDRSKAVWNVRELQAGRWAQVSRELASDPRRFYG